MLNNEEHEFRDRLHDYISPVDAEATWLAVEAQLQPRKKRRGWLWWTTLLVLLLGGTALALTLRPGYNTSEVNTESLQKAGQTLPRETAPSVLAISLPDKDQEKTSPAPQAVSVEKGKVTSSAAAAAKQATSANHLLTSELRELGNRRSIDGATSSDAQAANISTIEYNARPGSDPIPEELTGPFLAEAGPSRFSVENVLFDQLATAPRLFAISALSQEENFPTADLTPCPTDCWKTRPSPWFAQLETSVSLVNQRFSQLQDTLGDSELLQLYEANIQPLEALSADFTIGYRTRDNWTIRGGLGYTQINTLASSVTTTVNDSVLVEGVIGYEIDVNGDSIEVIGLVNGTERITRTQRYFNELNLIDVPLLVGKQFAKGRWLLNVEVGPVLNVSSKGSARLPLLSGEYEPREEAARRFRPSLGLGYRGQASVGYQLAEKLTLYGGIRYHNYQRPAENGGTGQVTTRYDLLGGNLGLRVGF